MTRNKMNFLPLLVLIFTVGCATTTPDVKINTSFAGPPANDEPTVAGHPTDTNNPVSGAHERFQTGTKLFTRVIPYYTSDGGAHWRASSPLLLECREEIATSADPWVSGNAEKYDFAFIHLCRNGETGTPVGWIQAAYATSLNKGVSWSAPILVSPPSGHADKTHIVTGEKSTYVTYVFFGVGEIKVFSSANGKTSTIGIGYGPATAEIPGSPATTYTAYIGYGNHLLVSSVRWEDSPKVATPVDLGAVNLFTSATASCDGMYATVPGTRLRNIPIPQITRGGHDGNIIFIAVNNYDIAARQFELALWHFRADTGPSSAVRTAYRYNQKHVIMPSLEWVKKNMDGEGNLIITFYLASIQNPYLWDYVRLDLDESARQVTGPFTLNTASPLNFFGTNFAGDYTKITGRAPMQDSQLRPFAVWTDARNHASSLECPFGDAVGTDIFGR